MKLKYKGLNLEVLDARIVPSDVISTDRSNLIQAGEVSIVAPDGPRPIGPDGLPFAPTQPDPYPTNADVLLSINLAIIAARVLPNG